MKQKHVILRSDRMATRDIFRGPSPLEVTVPPEIKVEVKELERRDIPKLTRDAEVVAVAPAMPMKLVEPLDIHEATPEEAGNIAWGVKAVNADTSPFTGNGIVVAVLDTGIDAAHPAFAGVELVQRNFTDEDGADLHGHGTHCAGTIFGRNVGGTRIGVAPGVKRALIGKVLGEGGGSSEQIVSAIQWAAENGAHVISMSLGIDFPGFARALQVQGFPPELAASRALEGYRENVLLFERLATLIRARSNPTLIVAAAGNESHRELNPNFELGVAPPAVSEGIISVAALGQRAGGFHVGDFSNTGANVSAPGVNIISARRGGGLVTMTGTSMATPHVAGIAALWAERISRQGPLTVLALTARVVGSATFEGFDEGFDPFDAGLGIVIAPQE